MVSEFTKSLMVSFLITAILLHSHPALATQDCEKSMVAITFEQKVKDALQQLATHKSSSQKDLVALWQTSILKLQAENPKWRAIQFYGPRGSVVFLGTLHHALVVTREGSIRKGFIYPEDFNSLGEWDGELHNSRWVRF